jgi:hypothetical protein
VRPIDAAQEEAAVLPAAEGRATAESICVRLEHVHEPAQRRSVAKGQALDGERDPRKRADLSVPARAVDALPNSDQRGQQPADPLHSPVPIQPAHAVSLPSLNGRKPQGRLEEELDALFGAPLEDFVSLRNARAAALRKEGEGASASALKEQTKPSLTAWAVNQVSRRRPNDVKALLESSARLREAQEAALRGGGGEEFEDAVSEERRLVRELGREAERVLTESGRTPSAAALERIRQTFRSAAADEEGRELLASGRFVTDFEPTGFGALTGISVGRARAATPKPVRKREGPPADTARAKRAELQARNREARQALTEAREHERELRRRLKKAEQEAERASKLAARAEAEAEALRGEAEEATGAVASAEQALFALRRAGG